MAASHHQQQKYAAQDAEAQQQGRRSRAAPLRRRRRPSPTYTQLTQLAQLHSQGILTDEEFAAKKAQMLGI